MFGFCSGIELSENLKDFLKQRFPENQTPNNIVISTNPQSLRNRYTINKRTLLQQQIYTIDQLANNLNVQRMIMSELEAEQFQLAYQYRNSQRNQFSKLPYGNSNYTFRFEFQGRLNNGRNVLVIGEKGSGKSTLINAIGNSLIIDYADRYRYHICEYDFNGYIQECDLDLQNVKFKFLEVLGYGQDLQQNQNIMLQTYKYLQNNNIKIDCIIICRRFGNQSLNTKENQIIYHLAEVFGEQYIQKCFLVNTSYDFGIQTEIKNSLQESLNRIKHIYDQMPNPKILFVNSLITPFEGKAGDHRFQTVIKARDAITQLIDHNAQKIAIINSDAFELRRQIENTMIQIKNQIKTSLVELLPCLKNYFSICEVKEDEDLFYANTVFWSNLEKDERIKNVKELRLILEDIILPDQILTKIENEKNKLITIDILRQNKKIQEVTYKEQFIYLRDNLTFQKTNRLQTIIQLADKYIEEQQHFLEQTYPQMEETKQQLITNNMNDQLRKYLQEDQGLEKKELQTEFAEIRQILFLPNVNLLATDIIAI